MKTQNAGLATSYRHELRPYAEKFHKLFLRNDTRETLGENSASVRMASTHHARRRRHRPENLSMNDNTPKKPELNI